MGIGHARKGDTSLTEDRKVEEGESFRSKVANLTSSAPIQALYTEGTTPAKKAGSRVFIYVINVFSHFGNTIGEISIEQPVGTELFPRIAVNGEETGVVTLPTPIPVGITGVFARAFRGTTVIGVDVQILGLEV